MVLGHPCPSPGHLDKEPRVPTPLIVMLVIIACAALSWGAHVLMIRALAWRGVTMERTRFGLALLFDTADEDGTPVRMLNVNGAFQSACYATPGLCCELACAYQRDEAEVVAALPRLRSAVVIGGGGFSFPKWLVRHLPPVRVTTVEIDPKIIEIARQSFYLADVERELAGSGRFDVVCADGWEWLRAQDEPADLIVNEAFSGSRPLGPLGTEEGARLVHGRLCEGGVYLANVRCPLKGRRSSVLHETLAVFSREFAHVWLLSEDVGDSRRPGNNTLVASDCDLAAAGCTPLAGHEWRANA